MKHHCILIRLVKILIASIDKDGMMETLTHFHWSVNWYRPFGKQRSRCIWHFAQQFYSWVYAFEKIFTHKQGDLHKNTQSSNKVGNYLNSISEKT
jgi:hypothetical protein